MISLFSLYSFSTLLLLSVELRKKTSGQSSCQLKFDHYGTVSQEPFYVPKTEEEIEDYVEGEGRHGEGKNVALALINKVKVRKGLLKTSIVAAAEKQRTMTKSK